MGAAVNSPPDVTEICRQLSSLVLHPRKQTGRTLRIEGGPVVSLYFGRGGIEVLVAFRGGCDVRRRAETFSTGRSSWTRERTHRLAPEFAATLAESIAAVMADPRSKRSTETELGVSVPFRER
jgi:hypothetical protein